MTKQVVLFLYLFLQLNLLRAQDSSGTAVVADTVKQVVADTTAKLKPRVISSALKPVKQTTDSVIPFKGDTIRYSNQKPRDLGVLPVSWNELLADQAFFNFLGKPIRIRSDRYEPVRYEGIFYFLVFLLFYFAIVKLFFAKYLANVLTLFFRASMRQQQLREQVLQSPFPSLLLNILFVLSGGLYGAFLLRQFKIADPQHFWFYFLFSTLVLTALYLLKYLILRIVGWIFNISRTVETYLFVVFMTNKIIGIFLLPLLVVMSFAGSGLTDIALTISVIMIGIFYVYRIVASYNTLHKEIKISGLHFFLYLCAFEIAPLLLIYKVLLAYLEKAY